MNKKIEDYLHLYLGCETNYGKLIGVWGDSCMVENNNHIQRIDTGKIKLHLSVLKSITNNQMTALGVFGYPFKKMLSQNRVGEWSPRQFTYLLSHHFDLFGLIDAGLAIDKTSTK